MPLAAWIVAFCLLGSLLSVLAAAGFLLFPARHRERAMPHLVSFAVGTLLGAAFLALLPRAVAGAVPVHGVMAAALAGLLGFFVFEKLILWRHCHSRECDAHSPESARIGSAPALLILLGDGIHNLVDGVLIAAAFLTDIKLGIVTSLAVAAHELPQELGDFVVLLASGTGRRRALTYNLLSGATSVAGGLAAYFGLAGTENALPYVLAVAAASFIYIAVADLMPGLHSRRHPAAALQQLLWIVAGILVIYSAQHAAH